MHLLMRTILIAAAFSLPAVASFAQSMERWGYPDPEVVGNAVHSLCNEQNLSVMLSARYRDQGRTKAEVLALIPENPPSLALRTIDAFRESVEDVFEFPKIGTYTLMVFRAEQCRREVMSARVFTRLTTVQDQINACEAAHGQAKSNELYACVRKVVLAMPTRKQ